jgi:hypothetical protein
VDNFSVSVSSSSLIHVTDALECYGGQRSFSWRKEMQLTLEPEEYELILRILEQHHGALLNEIWHTDRREFRLALREDEKSLESLLVRFRRALVATAHA